MANIPVTYRRFYSQLLHVLALPAFFFVFILIYRPFNIVKLLGTERFYEKSTAVFPAGKNQLLILKA